MKIMCRDLPCHAQSVIVPSSRTVQLRPSDLLRRTTPGLAPSTVFPVELAMPKQPNEVCKHYQ